MRRKTRNVVHILQNREICINSTTNIDLQKIAEEKAASSEMEEIHCKLPSSVRSTFLMSFSPDCTKVASTHGDHKIYVCDVKTGKLLHKLEGHPRTPWCLAFHPTSNDILASGCLGGEVRVWDLHGGSERWGAKQNTVITSLTFHPFDKVLVIATFNHIHFWNWNLNEPFTTCHTNTLREKVRFVKFNHLGTRLITGILNHPENLPDMAAENLLPNRPSQDSTPAHSNGHHRRSLWTRLMNMYQHIDGMEEFSRVYNEHSPTMQEEALNRARHYAEAITQANRLQRQLTHMWSPPLSSSISHSSNQTSNVSSSDSRESSESHEEFLVRAFWRTFNRLRTICSALERRMHQLRRNSEPQSNEPPVDPPQSFEIPAEPAPSDTSGSRTAYSHATSEYLINILTRLQNSLQFSAIANSVPPEQIQQLQWRISEILERLTNVTGYRARLTTLREHIFEVAERSERRIEGSSPISRQDLAHCLWLVEMSLQLTRQMQRILQADYRLTRLHLSTTSHSSPLLASQTVDPVAGSIHRPNSSPLTLNCSVCGHRGITGSISNDGQSQQPPRDNLQNLNQQEQNFRHRISNLSSTFSRPESSSNESGNMRQGGEIENISVRLRGDTPASNMWPRVVLTRAIPDIHSTSSTSHATDVRHVVQTETSSDSSDDENEQWAVVSRRDENSLPMRRFSIHLQRLQYQNQIHNGTAPSRSTISGPSYSVVTPANEVRPSGFYVPQVQIEPPPSSEDHDPLPVQDRPRSPPLPTILSGTNDFSIWQYEPFFSTWHPYFSQAFYEVNRRPQFGIHEIGNNYFHRIQSWNFAKYDIPMIMNAKVNIVVPKCKIHNDASVDISQDGEILVALVPSGVGSDLLTFAIYSLKTQSLGQCLYTSTYDANAISVSFSPLNQYVVIGLATPRVSFSSAEKEAVAHIYKLKSFEKHWTAINVRSLSQQSSIGNQVSLNSVQWLPQPGHGLIYGTNKGCLCICKPVAPIPSVKPKTIKLFRSDPDGGFYSSNSERNHRNDSSSTQQMSSASTQTVGPETQTTGTQTFVSDGNSHTTR